MIRKFEISDLDAVMRIWLNENISAHCFIPSDHWKDNFDAVRAMIPHADIFVYENDRTKQIDGFIGLNKNHIEGLFVDRSVQSNGIGKQLLDHSKKNMSSLTLNAYLKNERAVFFYLREGFIILSEAIDENTGEKELFMIWSK